MEFVYRCSLGSKLEGNSQTGHWGYWYDQLEPALVITNDSVIDVEMPTFEAGSACKLLKELLQVISICTCHN